MVLSFSDKSPTWPEMFRSMFVRALLWVSAESGTGLMILLIMATGLFASKLFDRRASLPSDGSEPERGGAATWPQTLPAGTRTANRTASVGIWRSMAGILHSRYE